LARIKAERDFEEKSKQLQAAIENNNFTDQQLAALQLLTKKVSCQPRAWLIFMKFTFNSNCLFGILNLLEF